MALAAVIAVVALSVAATHAHTWWHDFTNPSAPEISNSQSRFVDAGSNHRWVWWKESWQAFKQHPVTGTGAGSFQFTNLRYRATNLDAATEPHDLPVQFLTETGAVGALLFITAAVTLVFLARRRSDAELALSLALPAYVLHGLLDIDWDFVAVSAPVFLVAGALAVRATQEEKRGFSVWKALLGAGAGIVVLLSLFTVWSGNRLANQAAAALDRPARAVTLAKRARSLDPFAVDPIFTQALAEQARGRLGRARGLLVEATRVQPHSAEAWYSLAAFDLGLGCPRHALPEFERFYQLNPQDPGVAQKDAALKLVNSGKPRC